MQGVVSTPSATLDPIDRSPATQPSAPTGGTARATSLGSDAIETNTKPRIVVISNMGPEGDAAEYVLSHPTGRAGSALPADFPKATKPQDGPAGLRLTIDEPHTTVELWNLDDMLKGVPNKSSTEAKANALPTIFEPQRGPVGMLIGFGTAGSFAPGTDAGDVMIAGKTMMWDAHPVGSADENPASRFQPRHDREVVPSTVDASFFAKLDESFGRDVSARSMIVPGGDPHPHVVANPDQVSTAVVNITNYAEYAPVQANMVAEHAAQRPGEPLGFVETTFPVMRDAAPEGTPFIGLAAISDRVGGHFHGMDDPGRFPSVMASSFNAGIALGHLLGNADAYVAEHPPQA